MSGFSHGLGDDLSQLPPAAEPQPGAAQVPFAGGPRYADTAAAGQRERDVIAAERTVLDAAFAWARVDWPRPGLGLNEFEWEDRLNDLQAVARRLYALRLLAMRNP